MLYENFSDWIKANTDEAIQAAYKLEDKEQKDAIINTIQWLILELRESHGLLNRLEEECKNRFGEKEYNSISAIASIRNSQELYKHIFGDFEFTKLFEQKEEEDLS